MLRLAHRIVSQVGYLTHSTYPPEVGEMLPKGMDMIRAALRAHELPIILADNVAEYVACREEKESIRFSELPSAPPPFANCFIEWKSPSTQRHYDGTLLTAVESPELQQGCSVIRISPDDAPLDVFNLTDSERVSLNAVFFGFDFATSARTEWCCRLANSTFFMMLTGDSFVRHSGYTVASTL